MSKGKGRLTRRQLLMATAGLGITGLMLRAGVRAAQSSARTPLVWVWQFSVDDRPAALAERLSQYGLGILVKTHDGLDWMSQYDPSPEAIDGPAQVAALASYFEQRGVPFHAWCVVTGEDPWTEAHMAAAVLEAGARSLYLDVEPHAGFWQGTRQDALAYASMLRSLRPHDEIVLSIDPRPWMLPDTPIEEMAPYVNAIAPQSYWTTFRTEANRERFLAAGFNVPPDGPTPELLLNVSNRLLSRFGLPILHIGPGDSDNQDDWRRFISSAGTDVSLWRYGITNDLVLSTLGSHRIASTATQALDGRPFYVVEPGDSLSAIADSHGLTAVDLKQINGLADENYIYSGQKLVLAAPAAEAPSYAGHVVQSGDTLSSIAVAYGTTTETLRELNGLEDPDALISGQRLLLPR